VHFIFILADDLQDGFDRRFAVADFAEQMADPI
jgi:hypothetical protein